MMHLKYAAISALVYVLISDALSDGKGAWNTKYSCLTRRYVSDPKRLINESFTSIATDPPRGQEEWIPTDPRFRHGIDLVKLIRSSSEFSSEFCIGVAGLYSVRSYVDRV